MSLDAIILVAILVVTMAAFVFEWLPIDLVALSSLGLLLLFNLVTPQEAVSGFSNEAVVTVMMIFILSDGLVRSGLIHKLAHQLSSISGRTHWPGSVTLLVTAGALSAFINNVAALTIFMPVSIHLAKHFRLSPSKILLPLSYATIFGGACTLVGTSTNLLISSLAGEYGFAPFTMFEFIGLGSILFGVGMIYNVGVMMRLLPSRTVTSSLTRKYHMGAFLTELEVLPGSKLIDKTLIAEHVNERFRVNVLEILRPTRKIASETGTTPLREGDLLVVRGGMEEIVNFRGHYGLGLVPEARLREADLADADNVMMEAQVSPNSRLPGRTLKEIDFRKRFGVVVLALGRTGAFIREKLDSIRLERWDTLLLYGSRGRLEALAESDDLMPMQELEILLQLRRRWWISAIIVPVVMVLAATGVMSILKAAILGAVAMLVTRCLTVPEAYRAINWTVIFLVAAILPLGKAMVNTGLATTVGDLVSAVGDWGGPLMVVTVVYLITTLLTEIMSNNSTAVLMVPVVVAIAASLGIDQKALIMTVAFAASASFLTPMGYKTNAMVYGPGGYRFMDYIKLGLPLKLIFWVLSVALLPRFWPLG